MTPKSPSERFFVKETLAQIAIEVRRSSEKLALKTSRNPSSS